MGFTGRGRHPPESLAEEHPVWPNVPKKSFEVKVKRPSSGCPRTLRINLENCKYEVVREVAERLRFREVKDENEVWDLYWTDLSVSVERVSKMSAFQCINHFPGMLDICRKERLAKHLRKMQERFPHEYNFVPQSWAVPAELDDWRAYERRQRATKGAAPTTFIMKPDAGAMGRGVHLIQKEEHLDIANSEFNGWVLQSYINDPLLIDDYKFDLRIYVLVKSVDPLQIYLYEEGLARFATVKYTAPSADNLQVRNMHLTNYSVNKTSNMYVSAESDPNAGSKRRLSAVIKLLREQGHDTAALWRRIQELVVKTVLPIQPQLAHTYYMACSRIKAFSQSDSQCFELLGFDVLLDKDLQPWLMEVNHSPSFGTDTALDEEIKSNAIADTIRSLGLDAAKRQRLLKKQRKQQSARLYGAATNGRRSVPPTFSYRHNLGPPQAADAAGSSSEEEREEKGCTPPEAHYGGFQCIYPLQGLGEHMAPIADSVLKEWEARNECVCERCSQRFYVQMAQQAMRTFHQSALKLASERERSRDARFLSGRATSTSRAAKSWHASTAEPPTPEYNVGSLATALGTRRRSAAAAVEGLSRGPPPGTQLKQGEPLPRREPRAGSPPPPFAASALRRAAAGGWPEGGKPPPLPGPPRLHTSARGAKAGRRNTTSRELPPDRSKAIPWPSSTSTAGAYTTGTHSVTKTLSVSSRPTSARRPSLGAAATRPNLDSPKVCDLPSAAALRRTASLDRRALLAHPRAGRLE